jgi:hypothetical protein
MFIALAIGLALSAGSGLSPQACAADAAPVYQNDFEKASVGNVPEDLLVLDGAFGVAKTDQGQVLELPGSPLETYGVLFGPAETSGLSAQARFHGTSKGRRFPVFGIGLNGVGGHRLRVAAAKKTIELCKGDEIIASAPFTWESGTWTVLRLELVKSTDGTLVARGKAWKHGSPEPTAWGIEHKSPTEMPPGRPSIWGSPYAGTPIQFDDLRVDKVK